MTIISFGAGCHFDVNSLEVGPLCHFDDGDDDDDVFDEDDDDDCGDGDDVRDDDCNGTKKKNFQTTLAQKQFENCQK